MKSKKISIEKLLKKEAVIDLIQELKKSLASEINLSSIVAKAPVAWKWKCLYKSWSLRELTMHRIVDLLEGAELNQKIYSHVVSVILVRAAMETVALLWELNNISKKLTDDELSFSEFDEKLTKMLLGSRDESTPMESINCLTIISKANRQYPGIEDVYKKFCEKAHPNYDGLMHSYCTNYKEGKYTIFEKRTDDTDTDYQNICAMIEMFVKEYNDTWEQNFENLIKWLENHDVELEQSRDAVKEKP